MYPEMEFLDINLTKGETRKFEPIHEQHFVKRKNEGRKPDKDLNMRRLEFMPRNL
jgi:hypothetical protein